MKPRLRVPHVFVLLSLVILVIVGFPLTLVLAWLFDITPQGVKRTRETPSPTTDSVQSRRRWIDFAIIGLLAVVVAVLIYRGEWGDPRGSIAAGDRSIAVLPFVNMSDDRENEYFSDGLSEELLNLLAKIPQLHVAGRTSSFKFKDTNEDLRVIGEALNVQHVLEGSVRKSGARLRITAQLIDTENGYHLWSDTYDRDLTDIFAIQDEIAGHVVEELRAHLLRRFTFALYRFENRIQSTELFVRDSDSKGTLDKRVLAKVSLFGREPVLVEATAHDTLVAVNLAARRAKRAVTRACKERNAGRRTALHGIGGRPATEFG